MFSNYNKVNMLYRKECLGCINAIKSAEKFLAACLHCAPYENLAPYFNHPELSVYDVFFFPVPPV